MKLPPKNIGAAGEHYVAMQLNRHGVDTLLPNVGNPIIDVIAMRGGATASIQVKSSGKHVDRPTDLFMATAKVSQTDFLVLVWLDVQPVAFVLPRAETIEWCKEFNDGHATAPVTRMNGRSREFLSAHREAWHYVVEHLDEASGHSAAA